MSRLIEESNGVDAKSRYKKALTVAARAFKELLI